MRGNMFITSLLAFVVLVSTVFAQQLQEEKDVIAFMQDLNQAKGEMEKVEYSRHVVSKCEEAISSHDSSDDVKLAATMRLAFSLMPPVEGGRSTISEEVWDATRAISLADDLLANDRFNRHVSVNNRRLLQLNLIRCLISADRISEASDQLVTVERESEEVGDHRAWAVFWAQAVKAQGVKPKEISAGLAKKAKAASTKDKSIGIAQQISLMGIQEADVGIVKQGLAILKAHAPDSKWTKNVQHRLEKLKANPEAFRKAALKSHSGTEKYIQRETQKDNSCGCGSAKGATGKNKSTTSSCGCSSSKKTTETRSTAPSGCGGCGSAAPKDAAPKKPAGGCGGCGSTKPME